MAKKNSRTLVFVHGAWHICEIEERPLRDMWIYAESKAFCCYVDENKPTHELPPKPTK